MVDNPVFPFPDPKAYVETISRKEYPPDRRSCGAGPHGFFGTRRTQDSKSHQGQARGQSTGDQILEWHAVLARPRHRRGGHAVKYSAVSRQAGRRLHRITPKICRTTISPGHWSAVCNRRKQSSTSRCNCRPTRKRCPLKMHLSNGMRNCLEPITVATLRIPPQQVDPSGDLATKCESMSFNPWHALAEHRPMGGMNRLRKVVYQASIAKRAGH